MNITPIHEHRDGAPRRCVPGSGQSGFSLIELMIAILLSVFLIGGLLTLIQAMKRTTGVQSGLSQMQDNERFATDLLSDVIQAAGDYPAPSYGGQLTAFPALTVGAIALAAGQTISGTAAAGGDSIAVRYTTSGTDGLISCTGSTSAVKMTFVNVFSVDANGNLQCQLWTIDAGGVKTGPATVTLVSGITKLTILYGVQTNSASSAQSVDTYLNATQVSALAPPLPQFATTGWTLVKTVALSLAVTNLLAAPGVPSQPATVPMLRVVNVMNQVGEGQT
jgi:type IV pilus assembly protein PilW